MREPDPFSDCLYEEQSHLAEHELSSFTAAVARLYGPEMARLSAEDWIQESDLIDSPPRSMARKWCAVTIAASARLANRMHASDIRREARHIDIQHKNCGQDAEAHPGRVPDETGNAVFPVLRKSGEIRNRPEG